MKKEEAWTDKQSGIRCRVQVSNYGSATEMHIAVMEPTFMGTQGYDRGFSVIPVNALEARLTRLHERVTKGRVPLSKVSWPHRIGKMKDGGHLVGSIRGWHRKRFGRIWAIAVVRHPAGSLLEFSDFTGEPDSFHMPLDALQRIAVLVSQLKSQ